MPLKVTSDNDDQTQLDLAAASPGGGSSVDPDHQIVENYLYQDGSIPTSSRRSSLTLKQGVEFGGGGPRDGGIAQASPSSDKGLDDEYGSYEPTGADSLFKEDGCDRSRKDQSSTTLRNQLRHQVGSKLAIASNGGNEMFKKTCNNVVSRGSKSYDVAKRRFDEAKSKSKEVGHRVKTKYDDWSSGDNTVTVEREVAVEEGDDIGWRIISTVLKGWCFIWVMFAILVITAELLAPKHSSRQEAVVLAEEEQVFLEISERVVLACNFDNLDSESGRKECASLCAGSLCCFDDKEYSCQNDSSKMCAAYAGCESLIMSEDEAGKVLQEDIDDEKDEMPASKTQTEIDWASLGINANSSSSEMKLVFEVVSEVCADGNLHSSHGLLECASLCTTSLCCFDRSEIAAENPKVDLIMKLERLDGILDLSTLGTCLIDNSDAEIAGEAGQSTQFCTVHGGCRNLLLFGSDESAAGRSKSGFNKDKYTHSEGQQKHSMVMVLVTMSLLSMYAAYLLSCNRLASPLGFDLKLRKDIKEEAKITDVPVTQHEIEFV